jgi:hypothetical protein
VIGERVATAAGSQAASSQIKKLTDEKIKMAISGKKITDFELQRIFELRRGGMSVRDTARELDLHYVTVQRVAPRSLVDRVDGLLIVIRSREQRRVAIEAKRKNLGARS